MKPLLDGMKALGVARMSAMAAVGVGLLGLFALLLLRSGSEPMALLYGDLDLRDAGQITDQLGRQHIPFRIGAGGTQVLVPADLVAQARVSLARQGLPSGGSVGYEIFDRTDGLAATEFQQQINETRALEGELERTIRAINGIRAVRVHLVLPRREPFARERQDAQASVLLTMAGIARLDREGVQAILNLVAAAVPGLRPEHIAVIDSRGDVLARAGDASGPGQSILGGALSNDEVRRATEQRLARAVEDMLAKSLGPGRVHAEAAVTMNFDQVKQTEESYNPDGQVARSTQSVDTKSKSTEANPTVSVQNNLPNADAGTTPAGSQESRQEETTNYEISKTVRTLIRDQPQIERISLAVMVDGTTSSGPDGKPAWHPRSAEDLTRITNLVKTAIGYDSKRGDQVDVVSMPFVSDATAPPAAPPGLLGLDISKADLLHLAETGLIGVIGLLALLLVLRPMVLRLIAIAPAALTGPRGDAAMALAGPMVPAGLGAEAARPGLLGGAPGMPLLEDESLVSIAQIEGQLRASSIRRISDLADKHPEETLSIVRGWMSEENA
jgi:flagellar M-ring protein FliF